MSFNAIENRFIRNENFNTNEINLNTNYDNVKQMMTTVDTNKYPLKQLMILSYTNENNCNTNMETLIQTLIHTNTLHKTNVVHKL